MCGHSYTGGEYDPESQGAHRGDGSGKIDDSTPYDPASPFWDQTSYTDYTSPPEYIPTVPTYRPCALRAKLRYAPARPDKARPECKCKACLVYDPRAATSRNNNTCEKAYNPASPPSGVPKYGGASTSKSQALPATVHAQRRGLQR
jgi:hypothetical protein